MSWFKRQQKSDTDVTTGKTVDFESGSVLKIAGVTVTATANEINTGTVAGLTSTAAELNVLDGSPAAVVITHAAGAANIVDVTFTVNNAAGAAMAKPTFIDVWLSDAATGLAITTHPADTITASKGSVWHVNTAAASLRLQTAADGVATIVVTDTHKTAFYVCAALGVDPRPNVIHLLAGGDYGA
jgi:hypothetical protein